MNEKKKVKLQVLLVMLITFSITFFVIPYHINKLNSERDFNLLIMGIISMAIFGSIGLILLVILCKSGKEGIGLSNDGHDGGGL